MLRSANLPPVVASFGARALTKWKDGNPCLPSEDSLLNTKSSLPAHNQLSTPASVATQSEQRAKMSTPPAPPNASYCGDSLMGVSIAFAVVQIVVVAARFYTRHMQRLNCTLDDYLILPALIASLGQTALYIVLIKVAGVGHHFEYVAFYTPDKLVALQKGLFANQILDFPFTVTPAKISILLFYDRIFRTPKFRILTYVVGAIVLAHGIGVLFAAIFQCSPVQFAWDKNIPGGSCFDQQAFYRYVSPPNILTDLLILIMPLPFVWKLHTRLTQKLALTFVFILGGLGIVTSVLRMTIFFRQNALTDPTWVSVELGIWTVVEGAIIIIAACLPPIWPLISRILPRKILSKHRDTSQERVQRYPSGRLKPVAAEGFSRLTEGSSRERINLESLPDTRSASIRPQKSGEDDSIFL
ncbi:uncharacterized protein BJX67DRAFT_229130 [Aspergillus lucknowensis]|uniref:Rhodopsin domain-containing protein n=1 Tax=Aspergillus lucknowensis TaxID=176173 RepID=A0ABR4LHF8_9EURO